MFLQANDNEEVSTPIGMQMQNGKVSEFYFIQK